MLQHQNHHQRRGEKSILLIDGSEILRTMFRHMVAYATPGWRFFEASNALDGYNLVKAQMPDLIFVDDRVSGDYGYELAQILQEDVQTKSIPLILLSNSIHQAFLQDLLPRRQGYLPKPFTIFDYANVMEMFSA